MKTTIPKPLHWQDFESLCKILWGEIWGIRDKIKQNGRLGQAQCGVDVYGIPKGEANYSGIQCKGKDDYSKATLTKKEIDSEIKKAQAFKPPLETFIFATTANKSAEIEEYIRIKDAENKKKGGFEILLFCWEDIADLIEENRDTFNYYVLKNQFKSKAELTVTFGGGLIEHTVRPKYKKVITKYLLKRSIEHRAYTTSVDQFSKFNIPNFPSYKLRKDVIASWVTFPMEFTNTGSTVIEDYKLQFFPEEGKFRELSDFRGTMSDRIWHSQNSPLHKSNDSKFVFYKPIINSPLIQKDSKTFSLHILANKEQYKMKLHYKLLARDFNQEGELILNVAPEYDTNYVYIIVNTKAEIKKDMTVIEDEMVAGSLF